MIAERAEAMRLALGAMLLTLCARDARAQIDHVARCKSEVRGTMIWMSSTVRSHRPELSTRLNDVDLPAYCECFHARLRAALGDDLLEEPLADRGALERRARAEHGGRPQGRRSGRSGEAEAVQDQVEDGGRRLMLVARS